MKNMVISILFLFHSASAFALDFEGVAQQLCRFLSPQYAQVDVDRLIAKKFFESLSKDQLLAQRDERIQKFGDCRNAEIVEQNQAARVAHVSFDQDKSYTSVARVALNSSGKIEQFAFKLNFSSAKSPMPAIKKVKMRDRVRLETWIFLNPDSNGKPLPVILERTPYTRVADLGNIGFAGTAQWVWSQGYHYVVQAVRGTGRSEGDFRIFSPINVADARATLDWLDRQRFSDDNVAVMGTSYDGFTSLAAAVTNHPTLKLILAGGSPTNLRTDGFSSNGVLQLVLLDYLRYIQTRQGLPFESDFLEKAGKKLLLKADPSDYDRLLYGIEIHEWNRIAPHINHPESTFWRSRSIFDQLPKINVPTYHIAGMAVDGDLPDTVRNFRKTLVEAQFPGRHHLYLGYWNHGNSTPTGSEIQNLGPELKERLPALLRHYLKGEPLPFVDHQVMIASHFGQGLKAWPEIPFEKFSRQKLFVKETIEEGVILSPEPSNESVPQSTYWYRPGQLHGFTKDQHVSLFWQADREVPVLGELEFNISVGTKAPRMDILVAVSKLNAKGEAQFVSNCLFAKRFEVQKQTEVFKLTGDCPVFTKIEKGEVLQFVVTSNLFPQFTRVSTEPMGKRVDFQDFAISLLWNPDEPFVSIPIESAH